MNLMSSSDKKRIQIPASVQEKPSPKYPELQIHRDIPIFSSNIQVAWESQLSSFAQETVSTSQVRPSPSKPSLHIQV